MDVSVYGLIGFEIIGIAVFTGWLLYRYASKDVNLITVLPVFITWFLCFSIVALVPLDIYYTIHNDEKSEDIQSKRSFVYFTWQLSYWLTFLLTWFILPFLQEYEDAGEFTPAAKARRSLRTNLTLYMVFFVVGLISVVYFLAKGILDANKLIVTAIGAANCFGIVLITLLLGYGLVALPKRYWYQANQEMMLKYYYYEAVVIEESKNSALYDLEDLVKKVYTISKKPKIDFELKQHCDEILSHVNPEILEHCKTTVGLVGARDIDRDAIIDLNFIVKLNRDVKKGVHELKRAEARWELLLEEALHLEDVIGSRKSHDYRIRSNLVIERKGCLGSLIDRTTWLWHCYMKRFVCLFVSFVFMIFSVCVVLGEIFQVAKPTSFEGNVFSFIGKSNGGFFYTQVLCLIPLIYISVSVYYGLFSMKLSGLYGLYYHHLTDSPSLIFAAINFARVTAPICFNFLAMLNVNKITSFNEAFGSLELLPVFGDKFPTFFPLALILLILCNIFDVYGKILNMLGLNQFIFSEKFNDEKIDEGKRLLARARQTKERKMGSIAELKTVGQTAKLRDQFETDEFQSSPSNSSVSSKARFGARDRRLDVQDAEREKERTA